MKTVRKSPATLADLDDKLFPNSPIEVSLEDREYHVYVEGQWHSKLESLVDVIWQVRNIIKLYGDDWFYPSTRVNPGWVKWAGVSPIALAAYTK